MPKPSRICSTLDCGRRHHAHGFCRRCYGQITRKAAKRERSASQPSQAPQKVAS